MSDPIVDPTDLGLFLNQPTIDVDRAAMVIGDAQDLCETILSPLPPTAAGIVRRVAARCYTNPSSAHSMGIGSANVSYGSPSSAYSVGGMYLSRADKADLRRLAGRGGAFTIDPTATDAGTSLPPWSQNVTWLNGVPLVEDLNYGAQ